MSEHADSFTDMATRIDNNSAEPFGGACVIVPPEGDPIEILFLDTTANTAQFLAMVATRIQLALTVLEAESRRAGR